VELIPVVMQCIFKHPVYEVGNTNPNLFAECHTKKELGISMSRWVVDIKINLREKIRT
jgi:hypothetical protein